MTFRLTEGKVNSLAMAGASQKLKEEGR